MWDDTPLVVGVGLAKAIGLNEAIVIQQVHYWIVRSGREFEGREWIYNTHEQWQEQFPFWGLRTVQRIFGQLEKRGLILTGHFGEKKLDRTLWYSIDYDLLDTFSESTSTPSRQSGEMHPAIPPSGEMHPATLAGSILPKWRDRSRQSGGMLKGTEINTEINTEITDPDRAGPRDDDGGTADLYKRIGLTE